MGMLAAELADTYTAHREFGEKVAQEECARKLIDTEKKMASPAQSTLQTLLAHPREAISQYKSSDLIHSHKILIGLVLNLILYVSNNVFFRTTPYYDGYNECKKGISTDSYKYFWFYQIRK